MLRQEDPHPIPDTLSAAQTRVTPEELAHAIASLEARRLDAERVQAGTIPIGEAVRELNLDATPEEVLAEVRAQRAAQSASPPSSQHAQTHAPTPPTPPLASVPPLHQTVTSALHQAAVAAAPGLKQAALAASPALKQGMDALSQHAKKSKPDKRGWHKQSSLAVGIFFAFLGLSQTGLLTGHHNHVSVQVAPQVRYLSTVPDGQEVHTDTATVLSIAQGANPQTIAVLNGVQRGNTWTLVRHDKHWYVHANALESATVGTGPLKIYNQHNAGVLEGEREQDVTIRLDNSTLVDTSAGDNWSEIDLGQVHPDTYTHEDW